MFSLRAGGLWGCGAFNYSQKENILGIRFPCNADVCHWLSWYWDTVSWRGNKEQWLSDGMVHQQVHYWICFWCYYINCPISFEEKACVTIIRWEQKQVVRCRWTVLLFSTCVFCWPPHRAPKVRFVKVVLVCAAPGPGHGSVPTQCWQMEEDLTP